MGPSVECRLVNDLLALDCLPSGPKAEVLCSTLLSGCRARAVLLFGYDDRDGAWRLQGSSGLSKVEQSAVASGWVLSPPSIWQKIRCDMKLPTTEGLIRCIQGLDLPRSIDPAHLRHLRLALNDRGSRLLLVLPDPSDPASGCSNDDWEFITRVLALLLRHGELQDRLSEWESALEQDRSNLVALLEILDSVSRASPINNLYESTVDVLQKITAAEAVVLRRYDRINSCFHLVAERGLSADLRSKILCVAAKPIFADLLREQKADFRPTINREAWDLGYRQVVSVPLISSHEVVGSLSFLDRSERPPSVDQLQWLELLGRCVGLMIHQVQQAEDQRENAILQERSHLAREIHDGLAQLLGTLQLLIEEQRSLLEEGDVPAALDLSERLALLAGDAYGSVREEILALHDEATLQGGLRGFLESYVLRYERQWGISCAIEVEDGGIQAGLDIHPAVQSQLARIIQEALANVRRHAGATKVRVGVRTDDGNVEVLVEDDGSGFDTDKIPPSAYGLRIMQERAISVGGVISVNSAPRAGTVLKVVVPCSSPVGCGEVP